MLTLLFVVSVWIWGRSVGAENWPADQIKAIADLATPVFVFCFVVDIITALGITTGGRQ